MEQKLLGKVALVTGSSRGLGRALADRLALLGADLVIHDVSPEAAAFYGESASGPAVAEQFQAMGRRAIFLAADLRDSSAVRDMVGQGIQALGRIDVLVNCAGGDIAARGGKPKPNDCIEIPEEDLLAVLERNLLATMHVSRAVGPTLMAQRSGRIVNIASVDAFRGIDNSSTYSVAKAGIVHYTRCLAAQMRPYGVTVNCIAPGGTKTARFRADRPNLSPEELTGKGPLERFGEPEDIAKALEFFVTDLSDFVTGQCIRVDGGACLTT